MFEVPYICVPTLSDAEKVTDQEIEEITKGKEEAYEGIKIKVG